jgi:hypothetical protein
MLAFHAETLYLARRSAVSVNRNVKSGICAIDVCRVDEARGRGKLGMCARVRTLEATTQSTHSFESTGLLRPRPDYF